MKLKKWSLLALAIGVCVQFSGSSLQAQSEEKFKIRLFSAPALGTQPANVVGGGSATAVLTGKKLSITGSFDKMASTATAANLRIGALTGVRGNSLFDLTLSKTGTGTSGSIAGTFDLSPDQVDALKKGRLYVQIQSEGMPNGHLLGWLLK
jgi:CHRD domain